MNCQRCDIWDDTRGTPATTVQEYEHTTTYRCDQCAQELREYAALPNISIVIFRDEPLSEMWCEK